MLSAQPDDELPGKIDRNAHSTPTRNTFVAHVGEHFFLLFFKTSDIGTRELFVLFFYFIVVTEVERSDRLGPIKYMKYGPK